MTDKTELEVTHKDRDRAQLICQILEIPRLPIDLWDKVVAQFSRHRLATRTPDPTPVAWSDEESFKHLRLLYNYTDNDSHQFTRWQMVVAMSHGMRLARQPAVPADGLVEALCHIKDETQRRQLPLTILINDIATQALAAYRGEA